MSVQITKQLVSLTLICADGIARAVGTCPAMKMRDLAPLTSATSLECQARAGSEWYFPVLFNLFLNDSLLKSVRFMTTCLN